MLLRAKKADVISHWYALVPNFSASTQEFYQTVEEELKTRQVPDLEMSRVDFAEGGMLSANRQYLRMTREFLVFDICAAPFGSGYFYSCRFADLTPRISLWDFIFAGVGCAFLLGLSLMIFKGLGVFVFLGLIGILIYSAYTAKGLRDKSLDAFLLKLPVIGGLYFRFVRKETYYRHDTRLMYRDVVNELVKNKVLEVTGAKGIKLLRFNEFDPVLQELYKPNFMEPPHGATG